MKKVLLGILGIVVVLVIIGFFLPSTIEVSKSISINAPAANAFDEVNNLEKWNNWSYWNDLYKDDMKQTFGDVRSGVGGWYSWEGKEAGTGKITITESIPDKSVQADLNFMDQGTAKAWYNFEPEDEGTKLTMGFSSDLGWNPMMRWVGLLLIKPEMNKSFDFSLDKLKTLAEAKPVFTVAISEETVSPISYISVSTTMSPKDPAAISAQMATMYGELMAVLTKAKVEMTGAPFALYPSYSEESMEMVCALPVAPDAKLPTKYKVSQTAGGKIVKGIHKGDYTTMMDTHMQIDKYINSKKLELIGAPYEVYLTDPMEVKDTAQWVTEICYPIK